MNHIEYEVRVLEIDVEQIKNKLNELNAILVEDVFQRRYLYDFNPVNPDKWIRLRTNGSTTTLTIKDVQLWPIPFLIIFNAYKAIFKTPTNRNVCISFYEFLTQ